MSITPDMIRAALAGKRRRMRAYPEGNDILWRIGEYGFAAFCIASIIICLLIIGGVK